MSRRFALPVVMTLMLLAAMVDGQQSRRGRGRGTFGWRGTNVDVTFLVAMRDVQEELEVTSQQRELLESLQLDLADQRRDMFRGGPPGTRPGDVGPEEMRQRFQTLSQQGEKLVMSVLETSQAERLRQLQLQSQGVRALERDDVAKSLALSDERLKKIRGILSEHSDRENDERLRNLSRQERDERQSVLDAQVMGLLSGEQKQKWEKMKGEKFDFPERAPRFGPRGFRGR